jgi:hypothetical protein
MKMRLEDDVTGVSSDSWMELASSETTGGPAVVLLGGGGSVLVGMTSRVSARHIFFLLRMREIMFELLDVELGRVKLK